MEAKALDKQTSDKVSFISFIIPRFASTYKMNVQDAYFYLKKYGGWDLLEQLIIHFRFDEESAANAFYSSHTFSLLADETTGLYLKSWQEIYEMLKSELKM